MYVLGIVYLCDQWFFTKKEALKCNIIVDEMEPQRASEIHCSLRKAIFVLAVAPPRWNTNENHEFDRKIDFWPFVSA